MNTGESNSTQFEGEHSFAELIDVAGLQRLLEQFSAATGFPTGLICHADQRVGLHTPWRNICARFHRASPASEACCRESNADLAARLSEEEAIAVGACGCGLVDGAAAIFLEGRHVASLFTGQVLLAPPDRARFRQQAERFGYDVEAYLRALDEVPVVSEQQLRTVLTFLRALTGTLAEQGRAALREKAQAEELRRLLEARQQTEDALRETERTFGSYFANSVHGAAQIDPQGRFVRVNDRYCAITGYSRDELIGGMGPIDLDHPDDREADKARLARCLRDEVPYEAEKRYVRKDGTVVWVRVSAEVLRSADGAARFGIGVIEDITERRRLDEERSETIELLRLVNEANDIRSLFGNLTRYLRHMTGCEAVGVRLRQGDDFPYWETRGFPPEFVQAENRLCAVDQAGELIRDSAGNPALECMCGNILCGRFDPTKPFFTPHGSFWTNSTTNLLASTTEADRQVRTCNRCHGEGYESVALVPLRAAGQTFGLIQFNDRRPNAFTAARIAHLERLVYYVAIAVSHRWAVSELQASEKRYRLLADHIDDVVCLSNIDGQPLYLSPSIERLAGWTPTEVLTLDWRTLVHADDLPAVMQARAGSARGERARVEHRFRCKNGEFIWLELKTTPVHGPTGEVQGVLSVARDATERKRAEAALLRERRLFVGGPTVVFRWAAAEGWPVEYVSPNVEGLFGYSASYFTAGRVTYASVVHPDDLARVVREVSRYSQTGASCFEQEYRIIRADHEVRWLLDFTIVPRDEQGTITHYEGYVLDVTERRQAAQERDRLISAIEQAAEVVMITDRDGRIQYVNPAFERVTGYTRAEALGHTPRILKSGRHDAAFYQEIWETLLRGDAWRGRIVNKKKDGTQFTEEAVFSPVRDAAGVIQNFVAVVGDVTRELELEEQLREAQKLEAIGQLAGGVAHDFNNILTAILGNVELGLSGLRGQLEPDAGVLAAFEQIEKSAQRASRLTQQLLAFGRRQAIQTRVVSLRQVLSDLEPMLRRLIRENVTLETRPGEGLACVRADTGQLEQVIVNLVVNAVDAMPRGGCLTLALDHVELSAAEARAQADARPGRYVVLAVQDTGCGMNTATKERIFEPFFTTKGHGKGTGLGLATVYGIVKQSGGHVRVASTPGQGTTFEVFLPAVDETPDVPLGIRRTDAPVRGHGTILLCDDEAPVRLLLQELLQTAGYEVLTAANAGKAQIGRAHV